MFEKENVNFFGNKSEFLETKLAINGRVIYAVQHTQLVETLPSKAQFSEQSPGYCTGLGGFCDPSSLAGNTQYFN